jgi:hypothetical protein
MHIPPIAFVVASMAIACTLQYHLRAYRRAGVDHCRGNRRQAMKDCLARQLHLERGNHRIRASGPPRYRSLPIATAY